MGNERLSLSANTISLRFINKHMNTYKHKFHDEYLLDHFLCGIFQVQKEKLSNCADQQKNKKKIYHNSQEGGSRTLLYSLLSDGVV